MGKQHFYVFQFLKTPYESHSGAIFYSQLRVNPGVKECECMINCCSNPSNELLLVRGIYGKKDRLLTERNVNQLPFFSVVFYASFPPPSHSDGMYGLFSIIL